MNISPRKEIEEPQMRLCSSHLSNKNVFSNFRNESISSKMDLSSYREDRSRLLDHRPWMTLVQMSLFWFLECTAALRWQITTVFDRVTQKLRCSRPSDKKAPVHSNIGTSEWRSWKLSSVALATNEGCATLAWCDRISEYQWWTVPPRSEHSADVVGVPRWIIIGVGGTQQNVVLTDQKCVLCRRTLEHVYCIIYCLWGWIYSSRTGRAICACVLPGPENSAETLAVSIL